MSSGLLSAVFFLACLSACASSVTSRCQDGARSACSSSADDASFDVVADSEPDAPSDVFSEAPLRCAAALRDCGGRCVDVTTDALHCGACGNACRAGQSCRNGVCACAAGFIYCAASGCIDPQTDRNNCGQCGVTCVGPCSPSCGVCDRPGEMVCAGSGCVNVTSDARNCGRCGNVCRFDHEAATCVAGVCARGPCALGYQDCNGDASDGCETDVTADVANCGACGNRCVSPPDRPAVCSRGSCAPDSLCMPGRGECDGDPRVPCETDLTSDPSNCGACGHACPMSAPRCVTAMCVP